MILTAAAGQDNNDYNGGDGYSGGGAADPSSANGGQDGGYDGGDGGSNTNYRGGMGSGIDVSTLNMTRFVLTWGKAGAANYVYGDGHSYNVGGGGGILVNGEKPSGGEEFQGEGFGGGGCYRGSGLPGCVLIEV